MLRCALGIIVNISYSNQVQKRGRLEREQQKCFMQKMRIEEKNWSEDLTGRLFFTVNEPTFILK